MRPLRLCVLLGLLAGCSAGPAASRRAAAVDTAGAVDLQRQWWRALSTADTAFLGAHSAPGLTLTLSSGRTTDRQGTLAQALALSRGIAVTFGWSDGAVRPLAPGLVVASTRATETAGLASSTYRYLTVMERAGRTWRVVAAQSTRDAVFTPRVPLAAAGNARDYAGAYRTPSGATLRVVARDSALVLVEPSGREIRLEPVGPALFEADYVSPAGAIVRVVFGRDAQGRVVSMSRLIPGIVTSFERLH